MDYDVSDSEIIKVLENALSRAEAQLAAMTAERDALVGAAYEAAADALADYPRSCPDYDEWTRYDEQIAHSQACVLALTPTDATTALDHIRAQAKAEGRKEGLREAMMADKLALRLADIAAAEKEPRHD